MKHNRTDTEDGRRHVLVYGAVQGVGFRYFVLQAARRLDLAGYVRNRADGAVEIEAAGPADRLDELLRTVGHGPPMARVERVESVAPSTEALRSPFAIRH